MSVQIDDVIELFGSKREVHGVSDEIIDTYLTIVFLIPDFRMAISNQRNYSTIEGIQKGSTVCVATDKYMHTKDKMKDVTTYSRSTDKRIGCTGTALNFQGILIPSPAHSHAHDANEVKICEAKSNSKRLAETTHEPLRPLYDTANRCMGALTHNLCTSPTRNANTTTVCVRNDHHLLLPKRGSFSHLRSVPWPKRKWKQLGLNFAGDCGLAPLSEA